MPETMASFCEGGRHLKLEATFPQCGAGGNSQWQFQLQLDQHTFLPEIKKDSAEENYT